MSIAIKIGKDGRVPREVMDLLIRFAEHRDLCSECGTAWNNHNDDGYCATGRAILYDIAQQPEVKEVPENWNGK